MSRRMYAGGAQPTALSAPMTNADTSLTVVSGTNYPDGSTGKAVLTIDAGLAGEEKVLYTARSGNTFTGLTRGYDGTTAVSHASGGSVRHTISAVDLDEANAHVNATGIGDNPHPQYLTAAEGDAAYVPLPATPTALYVIRRNAANTGFEYAAPGSSGTIELWVPASAMILDTGSPAATSLGNRYPGWLMDATTVEAVSTSAHLTGWTTFDVDVYWTNAGAGSGSASWALATRSAAAGADLTSAAGSGTTVAAIAPLAGILKVTTVITGASAAGLVGVRVARDGTDGADTLTNDATLVGVLLRKAS